MLETKLVNYLNYYNEFQVDKYWGKKLCSLIKDNMTIA